MRKFLVLVLVAGALGSVNADLEKDFQELSATVRDLSSTVDQLKQKDKVQTVTIERLVQSLGMVLHNDQTKNLPGGPAQNLTIEERVAILEVQVTDLYETDADFELDIIGLDEDINFLFDEQVIQDERLLSLEQTSDEVDDDIEDLQDTTLALDFRVTALEENGGGGGGNSSVTELEERVETLEETAAEHETDIAALESITGDHEERLTATEENIEGLQTADIGFDERITALEESGGGGGSNQNNTIAFHAQLANYDTLPFGSVVIFETVFTNEGNGYDRFTGVFTVPPGGDGFYYFSLELQVVTSYNAFFNIRVNGGSVCNTLGDNDSGLNDSQHASCAAVVNLAEGDEVDVIYETGSGDAPVYRSYAYIWNVFSGFRI